MNLYVLQPPMPVHGIAGRYAAALYMAGSRAKKLDIIDKDLSKVRSPPPPPFVCKEMDSQTLLQSQDPSSALTLGYKDRRHIQGLMKASNPYSFAFMVMSN